MGHDCVQLPVKIFVPLCVDTFYISNSPWNSAAIRYDWLTKILPFQDLLWLLDSVRCMRSCAPWVFWLVVIYLTLSCSKGVGGFFFLIIDDKGSMIWWMCDVGFTSWIRFLNGFFGSCSGEVGSLVHRGLIGWVLGSLGGFWFVRRGGFVARFLWRLVFGVVSWFLWGYLSFCWFLLSSSKIVSFQITSWFPWYRFFLSHWSSSVLRWAAWIFYSKGCELDVLKGANLIFSITLFRLREFLGFFLLVPFETNVRFELEKKVEKKGFHCNFI